MENAKGGKLPSTNGLYWPTAAGWLRWWIGRSRSPAPGPA